MAFFCGKEQYKEQYKEQVLKNLSLKIQSKN